MGVAPKGPEALLWRESEEELGQLDVVWVGHRVGDDPYAPTTRHREPLKRLPGWRCRAPLIAGDRRLRRTRPPRKGALREAGAKTQLAHERVWGIHVGYDTSSGIDPSIVAVVRGQLKIVAFYDELSSCGRGAGPGARAAASAAGLCRWSAGDTEARAQGAAGP